MLRSLHAGLDWTGTPSLNESFPYGPGIVAVEDETKLEEAFGEIQVRFGFDSELKAHNSGVETLVAVLDVLIEHEARVGVLLLDKSVLLSQKNVRLPSPSLLRHQMACALIGQFMEKHALASLVCDDEVRGKKDWQNFRTDVLRINRSLRPSNKLKFAAHPSHENTLIQAADCMTYVFARLVRGALDSRLHEKLRVLQSHDDNVFQAVQIWDG